MKKILMFVCVFVMVFVMVGCGNDTQDAFERSKVRVDIVTASQIGKAVRYWDNEYNNDINFKSNVDSSGSALSTSWTKVSDLGKIEDFIGVDNPTLEGADYYVAKTSDESYKIVVGVSNNDGMDLADPKDVVKADEYDGTSSAIVWVEQDDNNVE